jgi:hypothetical protein
VLNYAECHEDIWGNEGIAPPVLTSTLESRFTSVEGAPGTHGIGGWVGPRADLDAVEGEKIFPQPGIGPQLSIP